MQSKISIIIPVFNEIDLIGDVVRSVTDLKINKEIIFVDDCSKDGTFEKLSELKKKYKFELVGHSQNRGKGAAIRTGLCWVTGLYSIIYDADLEYAPEDISFLFSEIEDIENNWPEKKEISVYGSRFLEKYNNRFTLHYIANRFLTSLTNLCFNANLTDMETCLKLCPTDILKSLNLESEKFEIEPELTIKLLKKGVVIIERPIKYNRRGYNQGKKIKFKDGLLAVKTIIRERFKAD
ncbi:MAG: glycosyltransferase family 2 protein [bacterium]